VSDKIHEAVRRADRATNLRRPDYATDRVSGLDVMLVRTISRTVAVVDEQEGAAIVRDASSHFQLAEAFEAAGFDVERRGGES